jgi:hypothetical protein
MADENHSNATGWHQLHRVQMLVPPACSPIRATH